MSIATLIGLLSFLAAQGAAPERAALERLSLLSVSPNEGRAVVQLADGGLELVRRDEVIPGTRAVVRQVLPDRLILELEAPLASDAEITKSVRIWLFKAPAGGHSRIVILDPERPRDPDVPEPPQLAPTSPAAEAGSDPQGTERDR